MDGKFLDLNAEEIEDPFGNDANDIPMESYIMDAEKTIIEQIPGYRFEGSEELEERLAQLEAAAQRKAALQAQRDLRLHVGELLLHQLVGGQRLAELLAVQRVLPRAVPAVLGCAHHAPGDTVAGIVQAREGTLTNMGK